MVDVNEEEVVTIPGTLLRSGQFLAAVACDVVGWTQLVATLMEARSTARTCLGPWESCSIGVSLDGLDVQRLMWAVGPLCPLLFSSLLSSACGDGSIHGNVLLLQKAFDYVSVPEACNDLFF